MKCHTRVLGTVLLLGCAAPTFAQMYQYPQRPVQWFINGGGAITQGATGDDFDNGWTLGTGVMFQAYPEQPIALRIDLNYSRFSATNRFLSANEAATNTPIDNGTMQLFTGFVDAQLQAPLTPWARFYALGGVGFGYRRIELTQNGFFCDPFFCSSGFGHNTLVASGDTTRFAWNAGAGIDFALPYGQSWFLEARYERIETPQATEFIPIRIGYRF